MKIRKVVIPAAGKGTRFLPITKTIPKEMLPVIDKPVIQYVVEEAVASKIEDIIIITERSKRTIEDYFDNFFELEKHLEINGKKQELANIRKITNMANFIYIRQKGNRYGNAIPVLMTQPAIGSEPFAVMWGDEFIMSKPPRLAQMIKAYEKHKGVIISGVRIKDKNKISRYGIADIEPVASLPVIASQLSEPVEKNLFKIKKIVEKPSPEEAPSNLATHGAYILPPEIFDIIKNLKPSKGGEVWLVDAINELQKNGCPVYAYEIENGEYYDTGNKLEYLKTVIKLSLKRPEFSKDLKKILKDLIK